LSRPLRVLLVEDSEDDADLLKIALKRGGYDVICERVDTPESMQAALPREQWDIVISDYVMPRFSGMDALKLVRRTTQIFRSLSFRATSARSLPWR